MSAADELTTVSRAFYEEARWKMATSIIVAAGSMLMLGLCAISGGVAASEKKLYDNTANESTEVRAYHQALGVGYGFACFFFVLGFVLLFAASIYSSPAACGTPLEKLTLKTPMELPMNKKKPDEQL